MKINGRKACSVIVIGIISVVALFVLSYWFPIFCPPRRALEFGEGAWNFTCAENELEIKVTSDGSVPYDVMFYEEDTFEIMLSTINSSVHIYIKGENDSDFYFWLVGNGKIKANGDIYIKNIKCVDEPFIDFPKKLIILKKEQ